MDSWLSLEQTARRPIEDVGVKAHTLARLSLDGAPVLPGWVLPATNTFDARSAAEALVGLAPEIEQWILRSSSALEDRPNASAAGLFASVRAARGELTKAIGEVRDSASSPAVVELLGVASPVAVLAQPYLEPELLLTLELRRDGSLSAEALGLSSGEALAALASWPQWPKFCAPEEEWAGALIEALRHQGRWWMLQKRPAPAGAPLGTTGWNADREHCLAPLCPLLASLLEALAGSGERLVDGVWYLRRRELDPLADVELERALAASERALADCAREAERLLAEVRDASPLDLSAFFARWQDCNRDYFGRPTARLRQRLREQPASRGALRGSIAARRQRELRAASPELWPELLERHGHFSVWPWEGRSPCAWEEPELLRALADAAAPQEVAASPPASLADRIALHLEDDDDTLARLYAIFRLAVRRAVIEAGLPASHWEEALELDRARLLELLPQAGTAAWRQAVDAGRTTARRWQASFAAARGLQMASGVGVVPGRVVATICRRDRALDGGLPPQGCILVVRAISPLDAVVFQRIAALAVESGDRLGHASILAREHGIPTVVGLGAIAPELRDGARGVLDAMEGRLALS